MKRDGYWGVFAPNFGTCRYVLDCLYSVVFGGNLNYYKIVGTDLSRMIQGRIRGGRR